MKIILLPVLLVLFTCSDAQTCIAPLKDSIGNSGCDETGPVYHGGSKAIQKLFRDSVRFLPSWRGIRHEIRVVVRFQVDSTGDINNLKIIEGYNEEFDNEAIRLMGMLKHWAPARRNGKAFCFTNHQPLLFMPVKNRKGILR